MKDYNGFSASHRMSVVKWVRANRLRLFGECEACGHHDARPHSEDYTKYGPWIGEFSLCYSCHMSIHTSDKHAAEKYRMLVSSGGKMVTSNYFSFISMARKIECKPECVMSRTVLDEINTGSMSYLRRGLVHPFPKHQERVEEMCHLYNKAGVEWESLLVMA